MISSSSRKHLSQAKYFVFLICVFVVSILYIVDMISPENNPSSTYKIKSPQISYFHRMLHQTNNAVMSTNSSSMTSTLPTISKTTSMENKAPTVIKETIANLEIRDYKYPSLSSTLKNFPWKELEKGAENDHILYSKHRQALIDEIETYAYLEPKTPVNPTCSPPPLLDNTLINCKDYPSAFSPTETKFDNPVKVGHAIQLGFDVDTLEIHLNEVYDVVDFFFILGKL